ncbi:transposase family protein, partial [Lampropedia aestuarii]
KLSRKYWSIQSWDVTYLPTQIRGQFFYLYLIVDIYSRKIVGHEVFESENMANSAQVIQRAVLREQCGHRSLVLHSDNGSAMKGSTIHAKLEELGINASHSRARISNDNAYSESLFRTCKYHPAFPATGFTDVRDARRWVGNFVHWYNDVHRHSEIRYVTPAQRHAGKDQSILARRHALYQAARTQNPARWSGNTRDWQPIGSVWLNPEKQIPLLHELETLEAA